MKILVVGPEKSGKTTCIYKANNLKENIQPTTGIAKFYFGEYEFWECNYLYYLLIENEKFDLIYIFDTYNMYNIKGKLVNRDNFVQTLHKDLNTPNYCKYLKDLFCS